MAASYAGRPEIAAALRGRRYQGSRHSATLGEDLLATADAGAARETGDGGRAGHAERGRSAPGGAPLDRRSRAGCRCGAHARDDGRLADRAPARAAATSARSDRRRDRARRPGPARARGRNTRAALARALVQRHDGSTVACPARAAGIRGRRVTPAPHAAHRTQASAGGGGGVHERGAPVRAELDAALGEVDRLSQMVDELLLLSSAGGRDAPAEEVELNASARAAAARWRATAADRGIALTHANGAATTSHRGARGSRSGTRRPGRERAPVFTTR